jgi:hypothetical protein
MVGKPHCEGRFVKPSRKFDGNIKIDSQEIGWVGVDEFIWLEDRDPWRALNTSNRVLNYHVEWNSENLLTSWAKKGIWRELSTMELVIVIVYMYNHKVNLKTEGSFMKYLAIKVC